MLIKDSEAKAFIQNIYDDLNFRKTGNELKFINASNVTDFTNLQNAKAEKTLIILHLLLSLVFNINNREYDAAIHFQ